MSDVWYSDKDERELLAEAGQAGATIERRGPRWLLYPLAGVADPTNPMWVEDFDALRAEVKARLVRRSAESGAPQPPTDLPPQPQQMKSPEQDVFAEDEAEDDDDDGTPHPQRRAPPRRRR